MVLCTSRSRRDLSNECLLGKVGSDTAENEPYKVCPLSVYRSPRFHRFDFDGNGTLDFNECFSLVLFMLRNVRDQLRPSDIRRNLCQLPRKFPSDDYSLDKKIGQGGQGVDMFFLTPS